VNATLRRVVWIVALLNLAYFGLEFAVALSIHSVSLFADSVDFLEDASVNFLIAAALGWTAVARARLGMVLAVVLLVPGVATLSTALEKIHLPLIPSPQPLSLTALSALIVNVSCALLLARYRHHAGSLTRAAFLSARNDVLVNLAILLVAWVTVYWRSFWPDLVVGLAIAALNLDAARQVWHAAHKEHAEATAD
jgi:Co/Zn/Cd efflux system component